MQIGLIYRLKNSRPTDGAATLKARWPMRSGQQIAGVSEKLYVDLELRHTCRYSVNLQEMFKCSSSSDAAKLTRHESLSLRLRNDL